VDFYSQGLGSKQVVCERPGWRASSSSKLCGQARCLFVVYKSLCKGPAVVCMLHTCGRQNALCDASVLLLLRAVRLTGIGWHRFHEYVCIAAYPAVLAACAAAACIW
jgi:hypothetical protein